MLELDSTQETTSVRGIRSNYFHQRSISLLKKKKTVVNANIYTISSKIL